MAYKYFKYPARYAVFQDEDHACTICKQTKTCLETTPFYSEDDIDAICEDCLKGGRLSEIGACANDADVEQLFDQLEALFPDKKIEELLKEAKAKTDEIELRTPPLVSWQEWKFPAIDGDYCQFVCFASKQDYNKLAADGDGKKLLTESIIEELHEFTDVDAIWRTLPDKQIKTVALSNNFPMLVYLFKSLHSEKYVTVWDIC